jgi:hypothetical protein
MKQVTLSDLAELTGKNYRTIKKRLDASGIEPVDRGKRNTLLYDPPGALAAIFRPDFEVEPTTAPTVNQGPESIDPESPLKIDQEALKIKRQREKLEMELAKRRQELLPAESVKRFMASIIAGCRTRLEGLPSKLAAMSSDPDEGRRFFMESRGVIRETLTELGRMEAYEPKDAA